MDLGRHGRLPNPRTSQKRALIFVGAALLICSTHIYFTMLSPIINPQPYKDYRKKFSPFIPPDKRVD